MEYIRVTNDNIETEHICCAISNNKDMQVSGGQSVECAYAFKLSDQTSPLTLTVHDNYSTFQDIGSTEIPIS